MPTTTLVPTGTTDSNSNILTGVYTDIDNTIASASGTTLDSVTNQWTGGPGTGSAFTFTMSDLPAEATSINTVQFRVRARQTGQDSDIELRDIVVYKCDVQGTNAPSTVATFGDSTSLENRGDASPASSSASVTDVNGWTVRVYQSTFTQISTADGQNLEIDEIEIAVDYNTAPPSPPSDPPSGGGYTVLPTTDTAIYGLCIAKINEFVVLGGMDTDRYTIRWCDIGDPTTWSTPATDAARAAQAGQQTFQSRYGLVTAIAGSAFYGYVFQERAITKMTYVGGDIQFAFDTFEKDRGCVRQGRMVQVDDKVFFQSAKGYHVLEADQIADIGYGVVDDTYG